MPVEYPIEDILRYVFSDRQPFDPPIIADLGCKDVELANNLWQSLTRGCQLFAFDTNPTLSVTLRMLDGDWPVTFVTQDLTHIPNRFTELTNNNEGIPFFDAVIANNLFCNLTKRFIDPYIVAASIMYSLKPGGYVFVLDHLLNSVPPYGSEAVHDEYQRRYTEALAQGRLFGDVWTPDPPRWVHHFSIEKLAELFPAGKHK